MTWRAPRGKPAKPLAAPVDDAKVDFGETDQPIAGFGFGDADRLAGQRLAEEDQIAAPFDLAVGTHPAHRVLGVVPRLLDPARIRPQRRAEAAGRRHLAERFVRAMVVKIVAEAVKAGL